MWIQLDSIQNIAKNSKVKAEYFVENDQLFELTKKNRSKIIFLFLGAGTVTDWAQNFAKELKKIYEWKSKGIFRKL